MVDVSGFSRMMGRDEEGTTALIREFHDRTLKLVESHEGRVVDTAGDSVFGEFDSVINAVRCAQAIQDAQAAVNADRQPNERIETRIGVHLGDVIVQDYRVYGDGVNIAARLQSVAAPGSICISEAVYQQVNKKLGLTFEDLGVQELKNIEHPIRLYRVVTPERIASVERSGEPPEVARGAGDANHHLDGRTASPWKSHSSRGRGVLARDTSRTPSCGTQFLARFRSSTRRRGTRPRSDGPHGAARFFPYRAWRRAAAGGRIVEQRNAMVAGARGHCGDRCGHHAAAQAAPE